MTAHVKIKLYYNVRAFRVKERRRTLETEKNEAAENNISLVITDKNSPEINAERSVQNHFKQNFLRGQDFMI